MRPSIIIVWISFTLSCTNTEDQQHKQAASIASVHIDTSSRNYSPEKAVKTLSNKEQFITVSYGAISCECAQWMIEDAPKEHDSLTNREYLYLSRANDRLPIADTLWDGETLPLKLKLTGRFYQEIGYPPGYKPVKGDPEPARVFQYSKLTVVETE